MIYQAVNIQTSVLISDLCDYSDAYILVKRTIIVEGDDDD